MPQWTPAVFYIVFATSFVLIWMNTLPETATARERLTNLFGATTLAMLAALVLAIVVDDKFMRGLALLVVVTYAAGWTLHLLSRSRGNAAHPYGNEQFQERYDQAPERPFHII